MGIDSNVGLTVGAGGGWVEEDKGGKVGITVI